MRGKRIVTATATAVAAAAASASSPNAPPLAQAQAAFAVPPPPKSSASYYSVYGASCSRAYRRAYQSLAFQNNSGRTGGGIAGIGGLLNLNAASASASASTATLDLSASASNEYLHTLSSEDAINNNNDQSEVKSRPQPQKPRPRPMIICGPSGVGKGTIIAALLAKFPSSKFGFSVSHTTRSPRPGEVNGTHYHFVSVEQIQHDIQEGKFLEYAEVHGNYYGTSLEAVETVQSQGKLCILDIDVQGVQTIQSQHKLPDAIYIFIAPPSVDDLERRLRGRGTETEESLVRRLGNAQREMEYGYGEGNFDYVLVNGELDVAVEELAEQMRGWYPTLEYVDEDTEENEGPKDEEEK